MVSEVSCTIKNGFWKSPVRSRMVSESLLSCQEWFLRFKIQGKTHFSDQKEISCKEEQEDCLKIVLPGSLTRQTSFLTRQPGSLTRQSSLFSPREETYDWEMKPMTGKWSLYDREMQLHSREKDVSDQILMSRSGKWCLNPENDVSVRKMM